jgi:6-phosphofructokinase 1
MRSMAVLTSGGDAPGMNAAIRAVVRAGIAQGWSVSGVRHGFAGLLGGELIPLGPRDVGGIIQQGGTILGSARCDEFRTAVGREQALGVLKARGIGGLVVIGGSGSQVGAYTLAKAGFPVVGVASTIDNDLPGSDITIGVDTALNIALEAIDRLKVTASSHERAFLVEVMGRDCGYLALMAGIAGGAEAIVIPEVETDPEDLAKELESRSSGTCSAAARRAPSTGSSRRASVRRRSSASRRGSPAPSSASSKGSWRRRLSRTSRARRGSSTPRSSPSRARCRVDAGSC